MSSCRLHCAPRGRGARAAISHLSAHICSWGALQPSRVTRAVSRRVGRLSSLRCLVSGGAEMCTKPPLVAPHLIYRNTNVPHMPAVRPEVASSEGHALAGARRRACVDSFCLCRQPSANGTHAQRCGRGAHGRAADVPGLSREDGCRHGSFCARLQERGQGHRTLLRL